MPHTINPRYTQARNRADRLAADELKYPAYQRRACRQTAAPAQSAPVAQPASASRSDRRFYAVYAACMVGVLVVASVSSAGV